MGRKMPQIVIRTGVSSDYWNEFCFIENCIYMKKIDLLLEIKGDKDLRKYLEVYNPEIFDDVITDENKERIEQLDLIVDKLNLLLKKEKLDLKTISELLTKAKEIILARKGT